ncbi:hypothetical protein TNCV_4135831 [Trichonephila clavipes]|nr:hypothetical protein TNCV_4135831 [Trichonephila clavipes]
MKDCRMHSNVSGQLEISCKVKTIRAVKFSIIATGASHKNNSGGPGRRNPMDGGLGRWVAKQHVNRLHSTCHD